jgi:hypothetical protein
MSITLTTPRTPWFILMPKTFLDGIVVNSGSIMKENWKRFIIWGIILYEIHLFLQRTPNQKLLTSQ